MYQLVQDFATIHRIQNTLVKLHQPPCENYIPFITAASRHQTHNGCWCFFVQDSYCLSLLQHNNKGWDSLSLCPSVSLWDQQQSGNGELELAGLYSPFFIIFLDTPRAVPIQSPLNPTILGVHVYIYIYNISYTYCTCVCMRNSHQTGRQHNRQSSPRGLHGFWPIAHWWLSPLRSHEKTLQFFIEFSMFHG